VGWPSQNSGNRSVQSGLGSSTWSRHGSPRASQNAGEIQWHERFDHSFGSAYSGIYFAKVGASLAENDEGHERWCNALAAKLLCVFILDRFGDFVSDQVVAPVRETVSQTLASLLLHMPRRSVLHVHTVLLQMIRQDFTLPTDANGPGKEKSHIWEVRHAGLLGIKYEVAVRSDVVEAGASSEEVKTENIVRDDIDVSTGLSIKAENINEGADVKMEDIQEKNGVETEALPGPRHILQDVVDAAVLGQVMFLFLVVSVQ
jgi:hypothetical protein